MDALLYKYLLTGVEPNFALPKKDDKVMVKQGKQIVEVFKYSDDAEGRLQIKRDIDDIEVDRLKYRNSKPKAMEYLDINVEKAIGYQITMFEDYKWSGQIMMLKQYMVMREQAATGVGADSLCINIKALLDWRFNDDEEGEWLISFK